MGRWIEITGTSKADLKRKAKKVVDKLGEIYYAEMKNYNAERYAALGSSVRLHKTALKIIVRIADVLDIKWKIIKNRVGQIPHWAKPKNISNSDPDYFNKDI